MTEDKVAGSLRVSLKPFLFLLQTIYYLYHEFIFSTSRSPRIRGCPHSLLCSLSFSLPAPAIPSSSRPPSIHHSRTSHRPSCSPLSGYVGTSHPPTPSFKPQPSAWCKAFSYQVLGVFISPCSYYYVTTITHRRFF